MIKETTTIDGYEECVNYCNKISSCVLGRNLRKCDKICMYKN